MDVSNRKNDNDFDSDLNGVSVTQNLKSSSRNKGNIVIMAGGTGGHIFPGLAVAKALEEQGYNIYWLGAYGLERKLVPSRGIPLLSLNIKGLRGNGLKGWLTLPFKLGEAVMRAMTFLREVKPKCVVGFGGFAAAPGGIAARLLNIPIVIHEQNAEPGLVNRFLSRLSKRNLAAFNNKLPRSIVVGNPVRQELLELEVFTQRYAKREGEPLHILVLGGSQGAKAINELMEQFSVTEAAANCQIWHQCGESFYQEKHQADAFQKENYHLTPFIDAMDQAYGWADLIICRAGALTVSEILAVNVATLFIPFPYAVDDHQTKNAQAVADIGGAYLYQESEIDLAKLTDIITHFTREKALEMASKTSRLAKPEATEEIVAEIKKVLK